MSHVIHYIVSLTCSHCGSVNDGNQIRLYTSSFGQDSWDTDATPDKVLELELIDFEDGFFTLRMPTETESPVIALETWGCRVCQTVQVARLVFERVDAEHFRFAGATVVPLSSAILDEAHFISRKLYDWSPRPGDDIARVEELRTRFGVE